MGDTKIVTFHWNNHQDRVMDGLSSLFRERHKTDVTLICNGQTTEAHQVIIGMFSPSIKSLFAKINSMNATSKCAINLSPVVQDGEDVKMLVEFLYTGQVTLIEERLANLQNVAKALSITGLAEAVEEFKMLETGKHDGMITSGEVESILDCQEPKEECTTDAPHHNLLSKTSAAKRKRLRNCRRKKPTDETDGGDKSDDRRRQTTPKQRRPIGRWKCDHCDYQTTDYSNHKRHVEQHDPNRRRFVCDKCGKSFTRRSNLQIHDSLAHTDPDTHERCVHCEFRTPIHGKLVQHLALVHQKDESGATLALDFKCSECDFICCLESLLRSHKIMKHFGEKKIYGYRRCASFERDCRSDAVLRCDKCDYQAAHRSNFIKHMGTVHCDEKDMKFSCNICTFKSAYSAGLKRHMNSHIGLKPYVCNLCGQSYADVGNFKKHMNKHANIPEKTLLCDICGFTCKRSYSLLLHRKRIHKIVRNRKLNRYIETASTTISAIGADASNGGTGNEPEEEHVVGIPEDDVIGTTLVIPAVSDDVEHLENGSKMLEIN